MTDLNSRLVMLGDLVVFAVVARGQAKLRQGRVTEIGPGFIRTQVNYGLFDSGKQITKTFTLRSNQFVCVQESATDRAWLGGPL